MECSENTTNSASWLLQKQYESVINRVNETQQQISIDLSDIRTRAEKVFRDFRDSQDIASASKSFEQLNLEIDRGISLKKIELMCTDLQKTEQEALALGLNVVRIGDSVRYIFQDAQGFIPSATKSQIFVHERAAQRRLLIAKSEFNKKIALKEMENHVRDFAYTDEAEVKMNFEAYADLLHIDATEFLLSSEKKTFIFEGFLDALAFLEEKNSIYRSNDNKGDAIKKMKSLLQEMLQVKDNNEALLILNEHIAKLKPDDPKFLQRFSDCHEVIVSFVNSLKQLMAS